ncbi:hypothetical protein J3E69DRAFT_330685 [Trichoderma sp. SZMC 28015]
MIAIQPSCGYGSLLQGGLWTGICVLLACWAPHRQSSLVRLWTAMGVFLTWDVLFWMGPCSSRRQGSKWCHLKAFTDFPPVRRF